MMSEEVIRQQKQDAREMGTYWMLGVSILFFAGAIYEDTSLIWPGIMLGSAMYCFIQFLRRKK